MNVLTPPPVLNMPFAENGEKNVIPDVTPADSPLASLNEGFKAITSQPISLGGKPPVRGDFNGVFNLLTRMFYAFQGGYFETFRPEVVSATGGYALGACLRYINSLGNLVTLVSKKNNNKSNFLLDPSVIGTDWTTSEVAMSTNEDFERIPYSNKLLTNVEQVHSIVPVGTVVPFAGDPSLMSPDYVLCDGRSLLKQDYQDLFFIIGNTYTATPSEFRFNVPDGRGVFIRGSGISGMPNDGNATFGSRVRSNSTFLRSHNHINGLAITSNDPGYDYYGAAPMYTLNYCISRSDVNGSSSPYTQNIPAVDGTCLPSNLVLNYFIKFRGLSNREFRAPPANVILVSDSAQFISTIARTDLTGKEVWLNGNSYSGIANVAYGSSFIIEGGYTIIDNKVLYVNDVVSKSNSSNFSAVSMPSGVISTIIFKNINFIGDFTSSQRISSTFVNCVISHIGFFPKVNSNSSFDSCTIKNIGESATTSLFNSRFTFINCNITNCIANVCFEGTKIIQNCVIANCKFNTLFYNSDYMIDEISGNTFVDISPNTATKVEIVKGSDFLADVIKCVFKSSSQETDKFIYIIEQNPFTLIFKSCSFVNLQIKPNIIPVVMTDSCSFYNCNFIETSVIPPYKACINNLMYNCTSSGYLSGDESINNTFINCVGDAIKMTFGTNRNNNLYINCTEFTDTVNTNKVLTSPEVTALFPDGLFIDVRGYITSVSENQLSKMIESDLKPYSGASEITKIFSVGLNIVPKNNSAPLDILGNKRKNVTTVGAYMCDAEINL